MNSCGIDYMNYFKEAYCWHSWEYLKVILRTENKINVTIIVKNLGIIKITFYASSSTWTMLWEVLALDSPQGPFQL